MYVHLESIGTLLMGIGSVGQFLFAVYVMILAKRNAHNLQHLEKNTNSIKDALVQVTGEAERAKGVLEGQNMARGQIDGSQGT